MVSYQSVHDRAGESTHTVGILALEVINIRTVDHIHGIDEELRSPHDLEEVPRALQFSHELDKQLRTSVRVYTLHETDQPSNESIAGRRHPGVGPYRWVRAVVEWSNRGASECSPGPSGLSSGVVGLAVGNHAH